jgi:TetR/AcrR family transcriptional regulator, repressor for neighboring sulfatase
MTTERPRGRDDVIEAILRSAGRLIAERGPGVALRDIADDAGVNFGLLYHYFGTKDQLIDEVYTEATRAAAARLAEAEHIEDALGMLMAFGDGTTARLIGWAVLGGRQDAESFGHSPALEVLTDRLKADAIERGLPLCDEDARVFTAFSMVTAIGWRLFGNTALLAAGLDGKKPENYRGLVLRYLEWLAETTVGSQTLRGDPDEKGVTRRSPSRSTSGAPGAAV